MATAPVMSRCTNLGGADDLVVSAKLHSIPFPEEESLSRNLSAAILGLLLLGISGSNDPQLPAHAQYVPPPTPVPDLSLSTICFSHAASKGQKRRLPGNREFLSAR
jgi:hypothetical protein